MYDHTTADPDCLADTACRQLYLWTDNAWLAEGGCFLLVRPLSVGLRTVTIRDADGVIWYVRNGEISRIGNKSQGWAKVIVAVPIGFADVRQATAILDQVLAAFAAERDHAMVLVKQPEVLGVEQMSADGAVLRVACKTAHDHQREIQQELHRRIINALEQAGVTAP